jgi:hypothetical protein
LPASLACKRKGRAEKLGFFRPKHKKLLQSLFVDCARTNGKVGVPRVDGVYSPRARDPFVCASTTLHFSKGVAMLSRRLFVSYVCVLSIAVTVGLFSWRTSTADEANSNTDIDLKPLNGKFLVISVSRTLEKTRGFYLTDVHKQVLGDRVYLAGKWFTPDGIRPKTEYWVAVNQIDMIAVYDNLDDLKKQYEEHEDQK